MIKYEIRTDLDFECACLKNGISKNPDYEMAYKLANDQQRVYLERLDRQTRYNYAMKTGQETKNIGN